MCFVFRNADYHTEHIYTKQNLEITLFICQLCSLFRRITRKNAYLSMNYIQQLLEISNNTCAKSDFSYEHDTPEVAVK